MNQKQVCISIGKDGSMRVEAKGFKGKSCEEATAFLQELFGKETSKVLKPSYWEEGVIITPGLPNGLCG